MAMLKFRNESDSEFHCEKVEKIFFFDWKQIESPFDILPLEMKTMIFIYLDPQDITQFGKCSKSCQKIFKLFRPKIRGVLYKGNQISRLDHSQNCIMEIEFHKHPEYRYQIKIETSKTIKSKETCSNKLVRKNAMERIFVENMKSKQLSTKKTKGCISVITLKKRKSTTPSTYTFMEMLSLRVKLKCHRMIALEMLKNIIEFNKSSIEVIAINANIIESRFMRSINIYSENLRVLMIDGHFRNHPQLNQFLSIYHLNINNFKLCEQHFAMIKSKYLHMHKTVMDKRLYEQFLKNWRDGELSDNLRVVSMIGDAYGFACLFIDNTIRFVTGENGEILKNRNHESKCEVVCPPSVNFRIQGELIDHDELPVRFNLVREDF
ncbi:unnamed protein product [Caenorhabditis angaria]|uniref:F-box domain-containing protein n=1 Tax=Caenorhabditis angaria TaxID=860376 RepID=A0A9P1IB93_9PELO|nr:unnamed protein product [Caenorhabditis angaria]